MMARLMGLPTIAPGELHHLIQNRQVVVIDVNAPGCWEQVHVPGATPLDGARFEADALPGDKTVPLVFYCSNALCRKAPKAARRALGFGHQNVRVLSAGIAGWVRAGLPTETGAQSPPRPA